MSELKFSAERFNQMPLVGIIRNISPEAIQQILPLYLEAGFTTIEITMNTPGVDAMIAQALEQYSDRLNVGAGTVCNTQDLKKALAAGAQFIVTPIIDKKVIRACAEQNIPIFPGAYTPTEIYRAWSLGATMVKVYPATALGPEYIKDVKAPLNQIKLMPTGGVNLANLASFLKAGADGFGIGSQLFDKKMIQEEDWQALKAHFEAFAKQYRAARNQ
ncbi:bifunctional 4-hydroxy-2-oxoglutarate aldolase/2-dehydro-3-deoxy-phosphogluconate aldolase [Adhaeribacter swui]|uniref:Bifunctional 4-hydroxy-2-oxoglutarate aldolase/2-dehydro-3-deoxy-phosphogluconate aldolase n=1 Tax=Adhaeribacter swui TaxID=2086471 RepID=A0A7G7G6N2_9BACT|nr:bifunctional 4-hydroxy-2-oxoglutarate aldolase/2-dehydro-3-deoxy-phosphogluconate aldolase [Adhaeribacter swui]QNF32816.1 bifunctional 4-hydroxy-2-oxoglutarate aldolase/2-dehydro-3-deoxy-phosphogluconate aldolase [Adhaeribacter swui]